MLSYENIQLNTSAYKGNFKKPRESSAQNLDESEKSSKYLKNFGITPFEIPYGVKGSQNSNFNSKIQKCSQI